MSFASPDLVGISIPASMTLEQFLDELTSLGALTRDEVTEILANRLPTGGFKVTEQNEELLTKAFLACELWWEDEQEMTEH